MPEKPTQEGSDTVINIVWTFIVLVLSLIPTWLTLLTMYFLGASNFWEKLAVFVGGMYCLGSIQLVFLSIAFIFVVAIWSSPQKAIPPR